jgi:RNA polymerase sigma factor (sigma-70 family)
MTHRSTCEATRDQRISLHIGRRRDDAALTHRAASGDERAWTLLVGRFDATIRSVARRHGLSAADQEDVAQRTWLAFLRHADRLTGHPAIGGWLVTTARRECLRVLAASAREITLEDPIDVPDLHRPAPDERILLAERREALHRAIERAPEHERRLLRLLLSRPTLSYAELSDALGIPHGSIGPTRGRCISRLRDDGDLRSVVHGLSARHRRRPAPGHDLS